MSDDARPSSEEQPAPYGSALPSPAHSGAPGPKRVRVHHLQQLKERGEKFAMLTAYDHFSAKIFEAAGIPILLVGDSAANTVLGYESTLPLTMDEFLPLVRAVTRSVTRPLVVADLPFGTYQLSPEQAVTTSVRMMKEGLAHAVKLEGGKAMAPAVRSIVEAGIPVMAHIGFTPQAEHALGGYRVQGRGDDAERLLDEALALQEAGAFAIVMEMVPAELAGEVTKALTIPTIGIGAGPECDAQVLVWQDMAGLNGGRTARFVKKFADLHTELLNAAKTYADEVRDGSFPGPEHSFE